MTSSLSNSRAVALSPITADVHMHTRHSHAQNSTAEMYRAAVSKGLAVIGFSEHSPRPEGFVYKNDYQDRISREFPEYIREVQALMEAAKGEGVEVLLGLELDFIPSQVEYARELAAEYPYDYIIGGLHFREKWGFDSSADEWSGLTQKERHAAYAGYYRDLEKMCRSGLFHIAAHPDLIKIFTVDSFNDWLRTEEALPLVRAALKAMKEQGMAMEVSSAGLRKPCAEIYPGPVLMAEAAACKLPISFASDAHCVNTPAHAFDKLARYASGFGYTESVVFRQGKACPAPFSVPPVLS